MNLYIVLGIRRDATDGEIKRAYRRLARKYHPNLNPGDRAAADLFERIARAFEVLSDPERRQRYDVEGGVADAPAPYDAAAEPLRFQGFDFSLPADAPRLTSFDELFADVFDRGVASPLGGVAERGADVAISMTIDFQPSIRGTRAPVTVTRLERCAPCGGLGRLRGPQSVCAHCEGHRQIRTTRGHMVFSRLCAACGGDGTVRHHVCSACGGEGVGVHTATLAIDIPAGTADGTQLVVPGEGHAGRRGGPAGALQILVTVRPHAVLRREGNDIRVDVPVAIHEAALGARIDIPTVDGPMRFRVLPGTQSGQVFRFRDRGAPRPDGDRGDLLVTVRLVLPTLLDERSRELLREFGERNSGDVRAGWPGAVAAHSLS